MSSKQSYKSWMWLILAVAWLGGYAQHSKNSSKKKVVANTVVTTTPLPVSTIKERPLRDSLFSKLKQDEAFWYANLKPQRDKKNDHLPFLLSLLQKPAFKTFVWIFITVSFTAVLLWYLAVSNVNLFRKTPKRMGEAAANNSPTDIFSLNYPIEIQNATSRGDFRLAIRLYYLQTLKLLSERSIIQYEADRTDSDYVVQLTNTSYYHDFLKLTQHFEYVWYGQMNVNASWFEKMQTDYLNFHQRLPH